MPWIILAVLIVSGLWAEPSVYGDSTSASSGQIKRNQNAIYKLKEETAGLREEIEGLRSIIEGLNRTVGRLRQQKGSGKTGDKKLLSDLDNRIEKIRQNYVSRSELKRALKTGSAPKPKKRETKKRETKKPSRSTKPDTSSKSKHTLSKASSSALYSKGVRLIRKKRYSDAKKRFDILALRGYKKAATHFYLGEIAYRTAQYTRAVDQYKRSAELNENTEYMDRLLLHTGLSLEKGGDRDQAKRFFQAIVDGYPGKASAKVAKRHLK
jgi:TolA-binding protein